MVSPLDDAIARAARHAPFLRGLLQREEALVAQLHIEGPEAALATAMARISPAEPMASLRQARNGVALVVALADLAALWSFEQVSEALTAFADSALSFAISTAFAERDAEPHGFAALALGKMGSRELNYSSDIDLIFIHDPEHIAARAGEDPNDAAVRIVRRVVTLLSERSGDGYAARVDLRLRPDPDSTPSCLPLAAAEHYYHSEALAWERCAFIRARAIGGDEAMGRDFLAAVQPFVWRRSLDYSALAEIRDVSHQIRDHYAERQTLGPGFDLKRGRGGIREVEFYAQVHQMIFGGRDPTIRSGNTLQALPALAAAGRIGQADADMLATAYRAFRTLEHRFQMIADQQTHSIPKQAAERAAVAGLVGAENWKAVEAGIAPTLRCVAKLYERLLASGGEERRGPRLPGDSDAVEAWAKRAKIKDPALVATLVDGWRSGRPRSLRAPESRRAFEAVLPALLTDVGHGRDGREALLRLDRMITALPSGVQFWRLLAAHPPLAGVVARLLKSTPLLADALAKRPALIDVLLEPARPLASAEAATAELRLLTRGMEGEALLDRVRLWTAERRFLLGVQLLDGSIRPLLAGQILGMMAEAAVACLAEAVTADYAARHGAIAGAELVVLALGRFGGGELTHQSDLDLVLLFTGSFEAKSTGTPPITASAWFNRLGPRLIAALTVPTAAGTLYEVDTRLRPSGKDGLLVVSLDSFARYQQADAELWEAMALTRARPVTGSAAARAEAGAMLNRLAKRQRPADFIAKEAFAMRRLMAAHKPPAGPFDVKLMRGGLVDIEFIVQARALMRAEPVPAGLIAAAGLLAPALAAPAALMMEMLVMLRLMQPHDAGAAPGAAEGAVLARACGQPGFPALKAALAGARKIVESEWLISFGSRY